MIESTISWMRLAGWVHVFCFYFSNIVIRTKTNYLRGRKEPIKKQIKLNMSGHYNYPISVLILCTSQCNAFSKVHFYKQRFTQSIQILMFLNILRISMQNHLTHFCFYCIHTNITKNLTNHACKRKDENAKNA